MNLVKYINQSLLLLLGSISFCANAQTSLMNWKSIDLNNPAFSFPYEQGEIALVKDNLFLLQQTFEMDVVPFGKITPQAANFWTFCVASLFVAKQGYKGWALAAGAGDKEIMTERARSIYLYAANAKEDIPEKYRASFRDGLHKYRSP